LRLGASRIPWALTLLALRTWTQRTMS
jgi:hypothetical protein